MTTEKTAIIAGATGLIGAHLLDVLLASAAYGRVIVLTRRTLSKKHPKLIEVVVDFDKLNDYAQHLAALDVFCCLGTTIRKAGSREAFRKVDHDYVLLLAKISLSQGAKRFLLVSAMGANAESPIFYNRIKGEIEKDVMQLPFSEIIIFRPSLLLGERREFRPSEHIAGKCAPFLGVFMRGPLEKYRPIQALTVAKAMLVAANSKHQGVQILSSDVIQNM